ncbi:GntR family transcriptional regulator [Paenibacillus sambharensis]|uniref:GntR family transcriptional regulator n=1 Tax=Paenibacillus sambharensis TaxID=1803190 RepID=A0A2W1LB46_9BACL|nr:GntR family transcriptional regulator [Paenibacillus sambharensis]PZD96436.1 GntR family transcriptional regulator [Paenibacillus sambharensis]
MNIIISNASGEPIYLQIVTQLRSAILNGTLNPGQGLPSIRQLAKDLQISVITSKRAYEELEKEGLIDSVVGKGSFVSGASSAQIREQRMRLLEEKMREVVREAKGLNVGLEQMLNRFGQLYSDEGSE